MNKDYSKIVEEFNDKQAKTIQKIGNEIKKQIDVKEMIYKVGYFDAKGNFIVDKIGSEKNNMLNYYWCEYAKGEEQYKITMFYKDFDCGSGNIHILPGAIQVWEKKNCKISEFGFCEDALKQCKIIKGKIEYKMNGGKPYCEYSWKPLIEKPLFWNEKTIQEIIIKLKEGKYKIENQINSSTFYKNVKVYSSLGESGHYKKYSLLKFKISERVLYYKTIHIKELGFFTMYDGNSVYYKPGNNKNDYGPNYYDEEKMQWIINNKWYLSD